MMKKFEYKTIKIKTKLSLFDNKLDAEEIDTEINTYGAQGWELQTIKQLQVSGTTSAYFYTFKREIN